MFQQLIDTFLAVARPVIDQQAMLAGWTYYVVVFWFLVAKLGFLTFVIVSHKRDLDRTGRVSAATFKKAAWVMVPALTILGFDLFVVGPANLTAFRSPAQPRVETVAADEEQNEFALSLLESGQQ